jgi:MFS family permease
MMMPAIQAYVGDITPRGREGFSMGVFNMSIFLGLSVGPVMGGSIKDLLSLEASFMSMCILSLIGFFLSLFLLPPSREEKVLQKKHLPLPWKLLLKDKEVIGLVLYRINYTACIGILWGFLPVFADLYFDLSSSFIGILVMLGVLISGIIHMPMGYVADRMNRRVLIITGGLIVGGGMIIFAQAKTLTDLVLGSIVFGLGGGISMPAHMAISVFKGSQTEAMGSLMGLMTMAHSLGMLLGSTLAGLMMDLFELRDAFLFGAIISFVGVGLFFILTGARYITPEAEHIQGR